MSRAKVFPFFLSSCFLCKTACVDRAKQSVPFKEKPPYPEAAEKNAVDGTQKEKKEGGRDRKAKSKS